VGCIVFLLAGVRQLLKLLLDIAEELAEAGKQHRTRRRTLG